MKNIFYDFYGYNEQLFLIIHKFTNGQLQPALLIISDLFEFYNFTFNFVIASAFLAMKIKCAPKTQQQQRFELYFEKLFEIGVIYCLFILVFTLSKYSFNFQRPLCGIIDISTPIAIETIRCTSSFPSAHAVMSLFIAYCLWPYLSLVGARIFAGVIIVITGIARMSLALHFPADIFYGYLIAVICILAGRKLARSLPDMFKNICRNLCLYIIGR